MTDNVSVSDVMSQFSTGNKIYLVISLLALIAFTVFVVRSLISHTKRTANNLKQEVAYYKANSFKDKPRTGNIAVVPGGVKYSRGSYYSVFNIDIQKTTYIRPSDISPWFESHRYTVREEEAIMNEIAEFLQYNRYCKQAIVQPDEDDISPPEINEEDD